MTRSGHFQRSLYAISALCILCVFCGDKSGECSDDHEPNDSCENARDLGDYTINSGEISWTGALCPAGDIDWFSISYKEETGNYCYPGSLEPYRMRIRLVPPRNDCVDLNLYCYDDSCALLGSSAAGGCQEEIITVDFDGTCGYDDSDRIKIKIQAASGKIASPEHYTVYFSILDN